MQSVLQRQSDSFIHLIISVPLMSQLFSLSVSDHYDLVNREKLSKLIFFSSFAGIRTRILRSNSEGQLLF